MMNPNDPKHVALECAIKEYHEAQAKLAPLLAEAAQKKRTLLDALGAVIVQFVEAHGAFNSITVAGQKRWYREMPCTKMAIDPGFQELIDAAFGKIEWFELYRPALEALDRKVAYFATGMGDCGVLLNEKLTTAQMRSLSARRKAAKKNSP